ncbi:hypothetical protein IQ260_06340 [Leptolyngbya cf. ectocarpi LEGE 11479]|uniref:Uncharacterized protein n=1 Tax=Leptolyngbya cf. ectocarpi LEGE 11479 TaxID=1828722 RepID=A0A928ZSH8_LEPEC|nr:hypothetical protein [Leptolyngbya ectocarpi]MBE9066267.1 hypothetical protein [Leptolyngbya cf. ectocarpi LEGE 11479]
MSHDQASGKETLNYRLRPNADGVCLDVWENSPNFRPGQASYRFFVTYQLKSAADAQVILDSYLVANDVYQAAPSNETVTPIHLRTLVDAQSL